MKQLQELSAPNDFSLGLTTRIESPGLRGLNAWVRQKIDYLAANRRDLLLTTAATVGITAIMLAASYLFFVQLAAYGW